MNTFIQQLKTLRRTILKYLVPELVWPWKVDFDGTPIPIRDMPFSFGIKRHLLNKSYEQHERNIVHKMIHKGDSVLEMGGSLGILTFIIANRISKDGTIVMIEASKENYDIASSWLSEITNITVRHGIAFPVWTANNSIVSKYEARNGSLGGMVHYTILDEGKQAQNTVANICIKDICELLAFRPQCLVIDIEGAEDIILTLKPNYPEFIRTIIIELHPDIYGYEHQRNILKVYEREGFHLALKEENVYCFIR